jgi:hypothetical protein
MASAGCGGGQGGGHIIYGSKGDGVKAAGFGHGFDPGSPDFGGKAESADYFSEECGFFVLGFGKGDLNLRVKQGDRQPWEACSLTEVEEGSSRWVEMLGCEEAFTEVATDDLFRLADGGEVGAGVPLEEKIKVS